MKNQPLRVEAGWKIYWNTFYEIDPSEETIREFAGSSLLTMYNERNNRFIDLCWRPEFDLNGRFILLVLNTLEVFNAKNNTIEFDVDWENPHLEIESRSRLEIVDKLEQLLVQLDPHNDCRILKNRGVIDQPSESFRIELNNEGLSNDLIEKIISKGNRQIQDTLIDFPNLPKEVLETLLEKGFNKKVQNKARQKLNCKRYRDIK